MARKEDVFDNDIEIIDFDLDDIEDRILSSLDDDTEDILPEIEEVSKIEDELPEISDALDMEPESDIMEPEKILEEVTQTVAAADTAKANEEQTGFNAEKKAKEKSEHVEADREKSPKKRKKSGTDIVRSFLMVVAVCILVYAGYQLTMIFLEYKTAGDEYKDIENLTTTENVNYNADYNLGDPFNPNFTPTQVDWKNLVALNSEIYAWIEFENTELGINYPVARGVDNLYYLEHTVNGTANSSGSIYIDCDNDPYLQDPNTFIYGHNMKNGSMFGNLKKYKNADFYAGNEYFWIYTPDSRSRYKIFTCYEPAVDSNAYDWWSDYCDEYTSYVETAKANAIYDTGVSVSGDDKIVTLSTCTSRDDYRFIVQAKLIYREFK